MQGVVRRRGDEDTRIFKQLDKWLSGPGKEVPQ
jgi:hypothetical protein